ncbi:MAG: hypothetical protein M3T55_09450 [Pseudomonadota bacterium]|nr:hypothetical protein [Pseudomonadota bacterium]
MKTVAIQGGLGNQLFGLAFAHSVATLAEEPVGLDVSGFDGDRYGHDFMLGDLASRLGLHPVRPSLAGGRMARAASFLPWTPWIREPVVPPGLDALRTIASRGVYFDGYWQNEAYIAEPEVFRAAVRAFLEERGGSTTGHDVVIHCRTYADELWPERRGAPGADFFERAIERIEAEGGAASDIALISDNLALAMERLGALGPRVTPLAGGGGFGDMALMLKARSLILANSSFSWWGGFCGEAERVIYPRRNGFYHYPTPASAFIVI